MCKATLILLTVAAVMGCTAHHGGVYKEIIPTGMAAVHSIATNPGVDAAAAPFPMISAALALAGFFTGGATGHYAGRKLAKHRSTPPTPSAPKLAA